MSPTKSPRWIVGLLVATAIAVTPWSSASASTGIIWGDGSAATFADGVANAVIGAAGEVKSISCSSAGNCTAVGDLLTDEYLLGAFVMSSIDGEWGIATRVENPDYTWGGFEDVLRSVSCWSAGNCVAVGTFFNDAGHIRPLIMTSIDYAWSASVLAGIPDDDPAWRLIGVSCDSVDDCTAVGDYRNSDGEYFPFTISKWGGTWDSPIGISEGLPDSVTDLQITKMSCASVDNCAAVGTFSDDDTGLEVFSITSVNGDWGGVDMLEFPVGTLDDLHYNKIFDVSCVEVAEVATCTAVGYFTNVDGGTEGFTVTSVDGDWGTAEPVTFPAGIRGETPYDSLKGISCTSPGNCVAVGQFVNIDDDGEAFSVTSTDSEWGDAEPVEFPDGVQHEDPYDELDAISCSAADACSAVGNFRNPDDVYEGFAVTLIDGSWGIAQPAYVATDAGRSRGRGSLKAVSCSDDGLCSAGGRIRLPNDHDEIFVVSSAEAPQSRSTSGRQSTTTEAPTTDESTTETPTPELPAPAIETVEGLPAASTPIATETSFPIGGSVNVSFGGFEPNEFVQLVIASTPQVIGGAYANSVGVVSISGAIPTGLAPGAHTLAVYAPGSGIGFSQAISVSAPVLPRTGSSPNGPETWLALWLVMIGLGAILIARRRTA